MNVLDVVVDPGMQLVSLLPMILIGVICFVAVIILIKIVRNRKK